MRLLCPAKIVDSLLNIATIHFAENPALFDAPFLKRDPGALAQDSIGRASAVFRSDGFGINSVGVLHPAG